MYVYEGASLHAFLSLVLNELRINSRIRPFRKRNLAVSGGKKPLLPSPAGNAREDERKREREETAGASNKYVDGVEMRSSADHPTRFVSSGTDRISILLIKIPGGLLVSGERDGTAYATSTSRLNYTEIESRHK